MVETTTELVLGDADAVAALIDAAVRVDRQRPMSDQAVVNLHGAHDGVVHFLLRGEDRLLGYAQLDHSSTPAAGELVVDPAARRGGAGHRLGSALVDAAPGLTVWAHGRLPGVDALAAALGLEPVRVLWRMRRSLIGLEAPEPVLPPGLGLRPFAPGRDEEPWTALNNRAFASHPDQGGWDVARIVQREREPWFDPAGFLLAERTADGALAGFVWTKIHRDGAEARAAGGPVGEIYVVGVDPAAQGAGLGAALTSAGMRSLRARGLDRVVLYVDESNAAAMVLYERLGLQRAEVDIAFGRAASGHRGDS